MLGAHRNVSLHNARYHHAKLVQDWLSRPDCRIRLHFIPAYCPHLNPIERLWGVMREHVTHNKCYATCTQFADATLGFLRETVPRNWANLCDLMYRQLEGCRTPKLLILLGRHLEGRHYRGVAGGALAVILGGGWSGKSSLSLSSSRVSSGSGSV